MQALRAFFRDRHRLAIVLVALALCLKAVVPAGHMVASDARVISVAVCADTQGKRLVRQIVIPAESGRPQDNGGGHAKPEGACAFSALAFAALGGADLLVLAGALLFLLAIGHLPHSLPRRRAIRFQLPPSRAPPVPA